MSLSIKKKTIKKAISTITAITTVVWLSGISMLAVPAAFAAVVDGDLLKTAASPDVYIVKLVGAKKFKRLILNPAVFNSYGHLKWENIQTVSQAEIDGYTTSSLVRVDGDTKVYALVPNDDTGSKSWVNLTASDFLGVSGSDAESIYTINAVDGGNYTAVTDVTTTAQLSTFYTSGTLPGGVVGTGLDVSLSAGTAMANTIVADSVSGDGAQALIPMLSLNFSGTGTVTSIKIKRSGISADSDISNMYLYDGNTLLADGPGVLSSYFTFSNAAGLFTVNGSATINVKMDLADGATAGKTIALGLNAATDVVTTGASVNGSFPVQGNTMSTASVTDLGKLTLAHVTDPGTAIQAGLTDQELWKFSLAAASQKIKVYSIKLTAIGTINANDLANLYLHDGVAKISSTVANLDSDKTVTFTFTTPYEITSGQTKNISLRGDVPTGTSRNFYFSVRNMGDILALDNAYGVYVKINQSDTFTIIKATNATTISAGSLSITKDTDSPSGSVARDAVNKTLAKFSVKAIGEAIKVTSLTVTTTPDGVILTTEGVDNGMILLDDAQIGTTKDLSTAVGGADTQFTFGNSFIVNAGQTRILKIVGDIKKGDSTSMTNASTIKTDLKLGSNNYLRMSTGTSDNTPAATGNVLTVSAAGLTSTKNTSIANMTLVKGGQNVIIGSYLITAGSAEGVDVTSLVIVDRTAADAAGHQGLGSAFDVIRLMNADHSVQYGSTINSPSSTIGATQTFTFSSTPITVVAGQSVRIDVVANVLSNASWTATETVKLSSATGIGKVTNNTVTDSTGAVGQQITLATSGTLTVANESVPTNPASTLKVTGKTGETVAAWKLSANNTEDIKVYRVKVKEVHADDVPGNVQNLKLFVGGNQVGTTVPALTTGTPDYAVFESDTGLFTIPKNGNVSLILKTDITGADNATFGTNGKNVQFQISNVATQTATTDISAKGATSSTFATGAADADYSGNAMKIVKTKPTLALVSPASTTLIPGTVEVMRFTITADSGADVVFDGTNHNIRFTITSNKSLLAAAKAFDLYSADTDTTIATQVTAIPNTGVTVDFTTVNTTVPAGTSKTYYVKAVLTDFTTLGDSFQLSIQNAAADFSWSDSSSASADINDTLIGKGLPLNGATFVKP